MLSRLLLSVALFVVLGSGTPTPGAAASGAAAAGPVAQGPAAAGPAAAVGLAQAAPVHGLAWGDQPRYGPGFPHFEYVNPQAPRTGSINLNGFGSFDKLNPFTLKGIAAEGLTTLDEVLSCTPPLV